MSNRELIAVTLVITLAIITFVAGTIVIVELISKWR